MLRSEKSTFLASQLSLFPSAFFWFIKFFIVNVGFVNIIGFWESQVFQICPASNNNVTLPSNKTLVLPKFLENGAFWLLPKQ
jgi:hypothetical protein